MAEFSWLDKGKLNRRDFLKGLGLAAGAMAVSPALIGHGQEEIVIGAIGPTQIFVGKGIQYGAQLAVEELNAKGGVLGKPLKLEIADTTGPPAGESPELARSSFEDLAITEKAIALVGLFRSEAVSAVLPQVPRVKVPLFIAGATEPQHTAMVREDYDNYKYVFRPMLNGNFLGVNLIEFSLEYLAGWIIAKELLRNSKVAIVAEDLAWVAPLIAMLQQGLPTAGVEVVAVHKLAAGTTDFRPTLADIESKDAAATITIFSDPAMVPFVATWAQMQVPTGLFGINAAFQAPQTCLAISGLAEGMVEMELAGGRVAKTGKTIPFYDTYSEKFGEPPVYTSWITYDTIYLWADAVEKAGTTDPETIVPFVEQTDWTGVSGQIQFYGQDPAADDPQYGPYANPHDSRYGPKLIYPVQVEFRADCAKEVIWPFEIANGSYLLPPWMRGGGG